MRWIRRKRARLDEPFPEEWRAILDANVVHWSFLTTDERPRREDTILWLVVDKRWEAARGFVLTDEIRVTIAAQAALLVLGFDEDPYENVGTIIVHPTTMIFTGPRGGAIPGTVVDSPLHALGVAHYDGPLIIAWDEALACARHPERGHNVVYHEFAHKLDMLDGVIDGTPPLPTQQAMQRWVEVCTAEYEALQQGQPDPLLGSYAAVDPAEFFAVTTELFFDLPIELEDAKPALYEVLRDFYRQDPAERVRDYSSQRK
ncbi:MAG TPA: M90 family metallopeptidase [Acidimicrobiia bacterium]|nr:M90 family metallopeptidase [Acidimicrobiia bacterium]